MDRHFDQDLRAIKEKILVMGGFVERAIEEATLLFLRNQPERLQIVYEFEERVNHSQLEVDEMCFEFLAKRAPVAKDLRFVLSVIKINSDLERMGDQAVNIAQNGDHYLKSEPIRPLRDLEVMTRQVQDMVRDSLDSFVHNEKKMAKQVIEKDDIVDELKSSILKELTQYIKKNPAHTEGSLNLILIARNLERLGDHATNIAEDVIFSSTGIDVRHPRMQAKDSEPKENLTESKKDSG